MRQLGGSGQGPVVGRVSCLPTGSRLATSNAGQCGGAAELRAAMP